MFLSLQKFCNPCKTQIHGIVAYRSTFLRPIYLKKFSSFSQVLKMHAKENWSFFLPHGAYYVVARMFGP